MNEYVDVDIIENGKVIGTTKVLHVTKEPETQNIKLEKVDAKTAYDNLFIKYAELEKENVELKADKQYWEQKTNRLTTELGETLDQLAQAKEIIEELYDKIPSSHSDYYKEEMEKTKQFLWGKE